MEILHLLATGNSISEVRGLLPLAEEIHEKYLGLLEDHKVTVEELSFTTRASKKAEEYRVNSVQKDVMMQLKEEGESIKAGQTIQYVITDFSRKTCRSTPLEMASNKYDVKRYAQLLDECCKSILEPFRS